MTEDTLLLFDLPAVSRKKVTADFEGGSISSDGGLVLLRAAERRLGLAEALAGCIREWRDPERVRTSWSPVPPLYLIRVTNGSFGAGGQCAFHREGGKVFSGNVVWICLPAIGKTLGAAGSAGESMAIPVASSSPHENPQTEPSGVQAASRSYR